MIRIEDKEPERVGGWETVVERCRVERNEERGGCIRIIILSLYTQTVLHTFR